MALAPGARVGPYEVVGPLGAGGMGEVYRARDTRLGRDVALKVLPAPVAGDAERQRRFEQEARAVGALNHPNVLAIHDVGSHEGTPFIVAELLEGATLRERVAAGPLPSRKALDFAGQIARGLAAAHDKGIVHRDLKPENLFVTKDGRVKILDFGLAKALGGEVSATESTLAETAPGVVLGTAGYMAPEQVRGRPADARADIFAFGAVLYEMLSGRRAFPGDSAIDRAHAILNREPPPLAETGVTASPAVERMIARCLEKAPDERFRSAADLGFALEALSDASGVAARAVAAPAPRRATVVLVLATLLVAFGVGGVLAGRAVGRRDGRRVNAPVSQPALAGSPLPVRLRRVTYQPGEENWPAIAPDGTWFVYVKQTGGKDHIFRQRVGGEKAIDLTPEGRDDNTHPAIAPDGERIAFRSSREGGGVFIMGATGESPKRLTDFGFHPAWSPDGRTLALSTAGVESPVSRGGKSQISLVNVESGERRPLKTGPDAAQAAWSPDGKWVAYSGAWWVSGRGVAVVPADGGDERLVFTGDRAIWTPTWAPDGRHLYFATAASGAMNIWRTRWLSRSGENTGAAESVTAGVGLAIERPSLSRDGRLMLLRAGQETRNLARVRFDARRGRTVGPLERLTHGMNAFAAPDVSPDGQWVTFCSSWHSSTQEDIFIMRADGRGLLRLTDDPARDRFPRFTADGRRTVFGSTRSGKWEIWSIATDGSNLTRVAGPSADGASFAVPSPLDARIATHGIGGEAFIFDGSRPLASQTPVPIARPERAGLSFVPFRWLPDGRQLFGILVDASATARGQVVYDLASRRFRELWPEGEGVPLRDGRRLVMRDPNGRLTVVDTVSRRAETLLDVGAESVFYHLAVSRDEQWIYFALTATDSDLWLAELK